jgi:copper chaperone NosL
MQKLPSLSRLLLCIAALMLMILYFVPFWQILMWAPQYPEWLTMKICINNITGDVDIINGLNHYIGMKHIKLEMFREFEVMPYIVAALIVLGLLAAFWGRRVGARVYLGLLITTGIAGMVDFYMWGYDYGHNLDPTAAIKVPGMAYQPPLIGTKELLNFIAYSGPDIGGWVVIVAGVLTVIAVFVDIYRQQMKSKFKFLAGLL